MFGRHRRRAEALGKLYGAQRRQNAIGAGQLSVMAATDADQSLARMTQYARVRACLGGSLMAFEFGDGPQPTAQEARAVFAKLAQGHVWNEDVAEEA